MKKARVILLFVLLPLLHACNEELDTAMRVVDELAVAEDKIFQLEKNIDRLSSENELLKENISELEEKVASKGNKIRSLFN